MIVVVQRFDHAGLHQVQNPDEDLRGRNVVPLQSLFATWMLKTVDDYISETVAMSLYDIIIQGGLEEGQHLDIAPVLYSLRC